MSAARSDWGYGDLVKGQPKAIGVTKPMPPVEDEGARKPVDEACDYRVRPIRPLKQRMVTEEAVPGQPTESDERQLNQIDCNRALVPTA